MRGPSGRARAQAVHRSAGTEVQAQEHRHRNAGTGAQTWEHRHWKTGSQEHRSTGAQTWPRAGKGACALFEDRVSTLRRFTMVFSGGCCIWVWWARFEVVALCVMFLVPFFTPTKHSSSAQKMCAIECVALHENYVTLRVMPSFGQEAGGCPHGKPRAKKKNTCHEVPLFTALMLASCARERGCRGGNSCVQEASACASGAAHRPCHPTFPRRRR